MFSVIKDKITTGFSVFWESVKSYIKNDNSSAAASLAYYSLFALIPLLLLLFFALSFFITSSKAIMQRITILISQFIPYYSDTILNEVYTLARHKGIWGVVSIGVLLWASMPLMGTLRTAFYNIFKVEKRPPFLKTKLLDIVVILLTLSFLVAVSFSNVVFKKFLVLGDSTVLYNIASYCLTAAVISVFYLVFIPAKVPFCYIFAGSALTTLLWGIIRPVFGLFLSYNPQYGITFGSLKALFIIIIWIYYSFSVLLFGTEVIANLRRKDVLLLRGLFDETHTDRRTQRLKRKFGRDYKAGEGIFEEGEKGRGNDEKESRHGKREKEIDASRRLVEMRFDVITIFPEIFNAYLNESILKRAAERNIIEVNVHNLRDFTTDRHRTVDDYPYGGGAGMVMKPEPFFSTVEHIKSDGIPRRIVMLTPHGKTFSHDMALSMSRQNQNMILICGRYEAIDDRVRSLVDEEISIGDYVLTGGELPALVIIDSIVRLIPGVLGDEHSAEEESFACGILEYPHYTRPPDFRGLKVPEVLLSGNHKAISQWRRKEALRLTIARRPDLMSRCVSGLKDEDYKLVSEIKEEGKNHEYD